MNKVIVENDQVHMYSIPKPIPSGQCEFSKVVFEFSSDWEGLVKFAQFKQGENCYNVRIDGDSCFCPTELSPGRVRLRIKGYPNNTESPMIATANELIIPVSQGFEPVGDTPVPPTPDLYQALIKQFSKHEQPDWNQNDESASDYVRNRPCYTESGRKVSEFKLELGTGYTSWTVSWLTPTLPVNLMKGVEYTVVIDGTTYVRTCKLTDTGSSLYLGNQYFGLYTGEDTGEPFCFTAEANPILAASLGVRVKDIQDLNVTVSWDDTTYHPIPAAYLPAYATAEQGRDFCQTIGATNYFYVTLTGTGDSANPYSISPGYSDIVRAIYHGQEPICVHVKAKYRGANNVIFRMYEKPYEIKYGQEIHFFSVNPSEDYPNMHALTISGDTKISVTLCDIATSDEVTELRNQAILPVQIRYDYPGEWYINGYTGLSKVIANPKKYAIAYVGYTGYSNQPLFLTSLSDTQAIWSVTLPDGSYVGFRYSTTKSECGWISGTMEIDGGLTTVFVNGNADDGWEFDINGELFTAVEAWDLICPNPTNYGFILVDGDFDYYCLPIFQDYGSPQQLVFETFDGENYHGCKFVSSMDDSGEQVVEFSTYVRASTADKSLGLTGAAVGQIAKITAVDTSGKPTAWEAVDMPSGGWAWTQHTDMTVAEDVSYVQIDGLPEDWKELYILIGQGSKPVYRKTTDDSEQSYIVMAGKAANYSVGYSSWYMYLVKGFRWCHVSKPDDKHFCAVSSNYAASGNSGFSANASGTKTAALEQVDPTSVTIFGWGITADCVVSAGTTIKIWYLK